MKKKNSVQHLLLPVLVIALGACSAPKPPQPQGSWQPVNHREQRASGGSVVADVDVPASATAAVLAAGVSVPEAVEHPAAALSTDGLGATRTKGVQQ